MASIDGGNTNPGFTNSYGENIDTNYGNLSNYGTAYQQLVDQQNGYNSGSTKARQILGTRLDNAVNTFKSSFYNTVGRQASDDEINQFLQNGAGSIISNSAGGLGRSENDTQNVNSQIQQFVSQNFQQAANQYATQQLQNQQGQAQSLADQFRSQGNQAISDTEQSLLDYQSQLFDRLRPNLITSLKSQGLLDTGGFNEAVAGVQGDLANQASNYISQLKLQNDQQANNIAFAGAYAPYQYQQSLITNQPGQLASAGENAMNFNNGLYFNNLDYQHQLGLINAQASAQASLQPSFFRTFGQNLASSLGQGLGSSLFGSGNSNGGFAGMGMAYAMA